MNICSVKGCKNVHYGLGFCMNHYKVFKKWGDPFPRNQIHHPSLCSVLNCGREYHAKGFCTKHYRNLYLYNDPLFWKGTAKGNKNHFWRGGTSLYKNGAEMKRNRRIKTKQTGSICEICGGKGKYVHHIDKSKTNHKIENLLMVCGKCHYKLHPERVRKSMYLIKFGFEAEKIATKLNVSPTTIYRYYHKGILMNILNDIGGNINCQGVKP